MSEDKVPYGTGLDLGPIKETLADAKGYPIGYHSVWDYLIQHHETLIAEVERLRERNKNQAATIDRLIEHYGMTFAPILRKTEELM